MPADLHPTLDMDMDGTDCGPLIEHTAEVLEQWFGSTQQANLDMKYAIARQIPEYHLSVDLSTRRPNQKLLFHRSFMLNSTILCFTYSTPPLGSRAIEARINIFKTSAEYEKLLLLPMKHPDLRMEHIEEVAVTYFRCVMLSHRWEGKERLLHDIQDQVMYDLDAIGGIVKLQSFCKIARDAGNIELQESLNSMFLWYHHSALTIVYLSNVLPSSKSGALVKSDRIRQGWTVGEFLALSHSLLSKGLVLISTITHNHKESIAIMQELGYATGIDSRDARISFLPAKYCDRGVGFGILYPAQQAELSSFRKLQTASTLHHIPSHNSQMEAWSRPGDNFHV
ncbi:hypothetical protein DFH29DRAFT_1079776 [Suillus ampliporus]|nr:hypothetical protein DFH29DRAFT_1079776 [Suillus ampliporus]